METMPSAEGLFKIANLIVRARDAEHASNVCRVMSELESQLEDCANKVAVVLAESAGQGFFESTVEVGDTYPGYYDETQGRLEEAAEAQAEYLRYLGFGVKIHVIGPYGDLDKQKAHYLLEVSWRSAGENEKSKEVSRSAEPPKILDGRSGLFHADSSTGRHYLNGPPPDDRLLDSSGRVHRQDAITREWVPATQPITGLPVVDVNLISGQPRIRHQPFGDGPMPAQPPFSDGPRQSGSGRPLFRP